MGSLIFMVLATLACASFLPVMSNVRCGVHISRELRAAPGLIEKYVCHVALVPLLANGSALFVAVLLFPD